METRLLYGLFLNLEFCVNFSVFTEATKVLEEALNIMDQRTQHSNELENHFLSINYQ
jgi:hypothetical protein